MRVWIFPIWVGIKINYENNTTGIIILIETIVIHTLSTYLPILLILIRVM